MKTITATIRAIGVLTASACVAGAVPATQAATKSASATVSISSPITVTQVSDLSFGNLQGGSQDGWMTLPAKSPSKAASSQVIVPKGASTTSALVRQLAGEAGRAYRITIPASASTSRGALLVNAFTLWTSNRQDVSVSRLSVFDRRGTDTLRLGATLVVPKGTALGRYDAQVPVTISYE